MANSVKHFFTLSSLFCLMLGISSCAPAGLAVPAVAVSGGAAGINYSLTNNAYKTISYPVAETEIALNKALKKMDINIKETKFEKEGNQVIVSAVTADLDIRIDLEKVTPTVTKIEVSAQKGFFFKDKATAAEIIVQTEKNLEPK